MPESVIPSPREVAEAAAAARTGDIDRAAALADAALARGIEHPLLLNLKAFRLEKQGRLDLALPLLERARQLAPGDSAVLNALGLCLARLERTREALAVFDAAIAVEPRLAHLHANRGRACEMLGELDAARDSFHEAVDIAPTTAEPAAALGALAVRRGNTVEARRWAERALEHAPELPAAAETLAQADLLDGRFSQAEVRLNTLLSRTDLQPEEVARARSLLGDVLDAQGASAPAFAAYTAANMKLRDLHAARCGRWGTQSARDMVEWLIAYFVEAPAASWRGAPTSAGDAEWTRAHVFLVGFPRSGTTLLERALAAHPDTVSLEEKDVLDEAVRTFMRDPSTLDALAALDPADADRHRRLYWDRVRTYAPEIAGKVLIDKMPLNTIKLPVIAKLFPDAKLLFAQRDPRDVVFSCFRRRFAMNPSMYEFLTLGGAARFYDAVMRLAEVYREKLAMPTHVVLYENTVQDFDATIAEACAFMGLSWHDEMRRFAVQGERPAVSTPSSTQIARGLYSEGIGQWRRYRDELSPVLPILRTWVQKFGYLD